MHANDDCSDYENENKMSTGKEYESETKPVILLNFQLDSINCSNTMKIINEIYKLIKKNKPKKIKKETYHQKSKLKYWKVYQLNIQISEINKYK